MYRDAKPLSQNTTFQTVCRDCHPATFRVSSACSMSFMLSARRMLSSYTAGICWTTSAHFSGNKYSHPPRRHYNRLARRMGHFPWPGVLYRVIQVTRYQPDLEMRSKGVSPACEV